MGTVALPFDNPFTQSSTFTLQRNVRAFLSPFGGPEQIVNFPGPRWSATYVLPPQDHRDTGRWRSFLTQLRSMEFTFLAGDPGYTGPKAASHLAIPAYNPGGSGLFPNTSLFPSTSLTPQADTFAEIAAPDIQICIAGGATAGSTEIDVTITGARSWDYSQGINPNFEASDPTVILWRGDYVQLGSELKMLTRDVTLVNGSTSTSMSFEPALRRNQSGCIEYRNPVAKMMLADNAQGAWSYGGYNHGEISFTALESYR